jgi:hypothetical protein
VTFDHKIVKQWALGLKCPNVLGLDEQRADRRRELRVIFSQFEGKSSSGDLVTDPRERYIFTCDWLHQLLVIGQKYKVKLPLEYETKIRNSPSVSPKIKPL